MPKLHLVAITSDNKGLVLSEQAESNRGDLVLDIDDRLLDAIDRAQRQRARDEGQKLKSAALPSRRLAPEADEGTERLTPRQIQDRIRAGESVAAIAKSSGTDEAWVERFAPPVLAEIEMIVKRALDVTFVKPRVGPSGWPLGSSVAANVLERGVTITTEEIDAGWTASHRPGGTWIVTFSFPQRGRRMKAEWAVDVDAGDLTALNKLATELGYRESGRRPTRPSTPAKAKPSPAKVSPAGPAPEAVVADVEAVEVVQPVADVEAVEEVQAVEEVVDDGTQTLPGTEPSAAEQAAAISTLAAEVDPTTEISRSTPAVPPSAPAPAPGSSSSSPDPGP